MPCDTLPAYLSISIGLAVIGLGLIVADRGGRLGYARSIEIFVPAAVGLQLLILRPITGAVLALMMKNDMWRD